MDRRPGPTPAASTTASASARLRGRRSTRRTTRSPRYSGPWAASGWAEEAGSRCCRRHDGCAVQLAAAWVRVVVGGVGHVVLDAAGQRGRGGARRGRHLRSARDPGAADRQRPSGTRDAGGSHGHADGVAAGLGLGRARHDRGLRRADAPSAGDRLPLRAALLRCTYATRPATARR